jgi:hypothetical protein
MYLLNVTIAGYGDGTSYPGSNQALKVWPRRSTDGSCCPPS